MNLNMNRLFENYLFFILVATLALVPCIFADFKSYPIHDTKDILYTAGQCLFISFISISLVGLIGLNKYIFAVFYPILFFLCTLLGYYAWTTHTTFTVMILDATLHNDLQTSSDLISAPLIIAFLIYLLLAVSIIIYRFKKIKSVQHTPIYICLFLIVMLVPNNINKIQNVLANHIPFNLYYVTSNYYKEQNVISKNRDSLAKGSLCEEDSITIVFVIGESLRADHLQLNGYKRNTTPKLSNIKNIVSLPNLYTKYTYTNKSLPFILTRADSLTEEKAYIERSFIDVFKHCGYRTTWLANQEPADSYVYFMHEADTLIYATRNKSVYSYDKWLDESLIPLYEKAISETDSKKLIILHTIGSHWWYNSHFTDEFLTFKPIVKSKIVSSNTKEEMINSYDNTILYTDNFLANIINSLHDKKAVLFYLSDHGESLGENNVWLHAADSPPIHKPAGLVWMSDSYIDKYPNKYNALLSNSKDVHSESYLFHSIIDAASIESPLLNNELSIVNPE